MNICQVTVGLLPIPPNGWGAVEKIIWEYHCNSIQFGYNSEIKYLNEVVKDNYDIIHQHVANLALEGKGRGIDYIFTLHDHHTYVYGKDSDTYKQNLEAIDKSIISFVPAKFLLGYFNNHPKLHYLEHGVNTDFFKPGLIKHEGHKLLCVANNGFANNQGFDRKGFSYAINAAKILNLPITIVGPSNNKNFFNSFNQDYDKLNLLFDLNENQLLEVYQDHTIFLHPSILEAGHPNLTLLEAMSCGLPVIATFEYDNELPGLYRIERDIKQIIDAVVYTINNYEKVSKMCLETANKHSFKNVTKKLITLYNQTLNKKETMKDKLIKIYNETEINHINTIFKPNVVNYTFINGPKVEILGNNSGEYYIEFINSDKNTVEYSTTITNNCWCKCNKEYYINWDIKVYQNGVLFSEHLFNLKDKHVYIALDSSAIGDTIAWFPIIDEFRKKHSCNVSVSTFKNDWFTDNYPDLTFINPGEVVYGIYAMYTIGWYYNDKEINYDKIPINFRLHSLQETATSILGLDKIEIKPKINVINKNSNFKERYVVIAPHASAHAKYWNHKGGWQIVINYLNSIGYKVIMLTQEKLGDGWHDSKLDGTLTGVIDKTGNIPMQDRFTDILNADLFIGVGSGLSWVSWALGTKTILISGFSYPYSEFTDCVRLFNDDNNICGGCFNRHWLNPGDWEWCPDHKSTERMFECTKTINPLTVINSINQLVNQ
jgi:autotransporter strand-loop-strand O-heptosyltransferase